MSLKPAFLLVLLISLPAFSAPRAEKLMCQGVISRFFKDIEKVKRENDHVEGKDADLSNWRISMSDDTGSAVETSYEAYGTKGQVEIPLTETDLTGRNGKKMTRVNGKFVFTFYRGYQIELSSGFFEQPMYGDYSVLNATSAGLYLTAKLVHVDPTTKKKTVLGISSGDSRPLVAGENSVSANVGVDSVAFANGILRALEAGEDLTKNVHNTDDNYAPVVLKGYMEDGAPMDAQVYCDLTLAPKK